MSRKSPTFTGRVPFEQRTPLAQQIISARKAAGLTQADLAWLLGTAQSNVAHIETGFVIPSERRIARIFATIAEYSGSRR